MATMDRIAMFCHKVAMHSLTLHGATRTSPCANELVGSMSRTLNPTFTTAPPSIWSALYAFIRNNHVEAHCPRECFPRAVDRMRDGWQAVSARTARGGES